MRIGITGAQGTGKTTLASALSKVLEIPLIKEQARFVAKRLKINRMSELKYDPELAATFQLECLHSQLRAENLYSCFVSDRTTIDNAVYWLKWHSHRHESWKNNQYYQMALSNVLNYDLVIYVPPEIHLQDDGFRSVNSFYQAEIDLYIRCFLAYVETDWITVTGSLENRVNKVLVELKGVV